MKGFRKCNECQKPFSLEFRNTNAKYCDDNCRSIVRRRTQKTDRQKRYNRLHSDDKDYICNEIYIKYKSIAPKRGLTFDLTIDIFKQYFRTECYYCNDIMVNVGFDRVNNSIGYMESNIVPCCLTCNMMKHSMSVELFLSHCKKIANLNV
jgi:hypothetical protein